MPYSVLKSLGIPDKLTSTHITLQLANRSLAYPKGVLHDVLVRVGSFIYPAEFCYPRDEGR